MPGVVTVVDTPQEKGGRARAKALTSEQRREIALQAARARWARIADPSNIPTASHRGTLKIGDVPIEVYRLKDGRRLIAKKAMARALLLKSAGGNAFLRTVTRQGVRSAIDDKLWAQIESPIVFNTIDPDSGGGLAVSADGYEEAVLIDVCGALIRAGQQGALADSQFFLARQAEIIVRSAAKVGLAALIDEAVGYKNKRQDEYRQLWQAFIKDECKQWEKEVPDKFPDMLYKLYGLRRFDSTSSRHPRFFAKFMRKYVYHPLANSNGMVLEALDEKNPVVYTNGGRKYKLFQFLSDEIGLPAFRQHLWQVIGIGMGATNRKKFDEAFYRAFPEAVPLGHQWPLGGIDDDDFA